MRAAGHRALVVLTRYVTVLQDQADQAVARGNVPAATKVRQQASDCALQLSLLDQRLRTIAESVVPPEESPGSLTSRQQAIAICIAEGLSNEEIAARLGITAGTVANYVGQILRRLGARNRAQIATWAVERRRL